MIIIIMALLLLLLSCHASSQPDSAFGIENWNTICSRSVSRVGGEPSLMDEVEHGVNEFIIIIIIIIIIMARRVRAEFEIGAQNGGINYVLTL